MESWWNDRYFRAGLIGLVIFLGTRFILFLIEAAFNITLPLPFLLALIPAGIASYLILARYRYG